MGDYFNGRGFIEVLETPMAAIDSIQSFNMSCESQDSESKISPMFYRCRHLGTEVEVYSGKLSFGLCRGEVVVSFSCPCGRSHTLEVDA